MSLKINFYCDENYHNAVPEPIPSSKSFPKWFSELPLVNKKFRYKTNADDVYTLVPNLDNNVKKCLGITEFLNHGYIIPSWADFIFREDINGTLYVNWMENFYDQTKYSFHPDTEYSTMPNKPIYGHFGKIYTPWIIKTDPGVSVLITHPVWHRNKSFTTSTAVIHTDATPLPLAWFFEWNYKIQTKMDIENIDEKNQVVGKGEPIISIIPFYRKNFISKVNYLPSNKILSMSRSSSNLTSDTMGGQCPYKKFRKTLGSLFR